MTDEATPAPPTDPTPTDSAPTTGITTLDGALQDVATLADRPVTEHVAVFEAVHAELRRPLDDPPAELDPPDPHA